MTIVSALRAVKNRIKRYLLAPIVYECKASFAVLYEWDIKSKIGIPDIITT